MAMLGIKQPWRAHTQPWGGNGLVFDHLLPGKKSVFLPIIAKSRTLIPLRHPRSVFKSWTDRQKPVDVLADMWRIMAHEVAPLDPLFIPLDSPRKGAFLARARRATGMKLPANRKPKGQVHGNAALDWRMLPEYEIEDELGEFLSRFY